MSYVFFRKYVFDVFMMLNRNIFLYEDRVWFISEKEEK